MKITLKNKIALGLIAATIITNPLPGQYVLQGLDTVFAWMFAHMAWITLITAVYMIGLIFLNMWETREKVTVPKGKTKTQAYIKT